MHERIKELRKELNLTQTEFGNKIGMRQTGVAWLESGNRKITDRVLSTICAVFGVNEDWLRNGSGEMFVVTRESIVDEMVKKFNFGDTERKFLEVFISLPQDERDAFMEFVRRFATNVNASKVMPDDKTQLLLIANSKDGQVKPRIETVNESEVDALFDLPDTDQH